MRRRLWLKYFIYIILLCLLIFLKEYVLDRIEYIFYRNWGGGGSYLLLVLLPFIFNLVIGLLLGFEYFINERRKVGSWKITLPKLILLGLPSLFFSLTHLIALINNTFIQDKLLIFSRLGTNFIPVFQIILGYTAITCLYKYNGENEDEYSGERES